MVVGWFGMKSIIIKSEQTKLYCKSLIDEMPEDGTRTVVLKNTPTDSTAKQRQLQWKWYTEVSQSGLGQDDNKEGVHIRAKLMFAHPILMRDDDVYPILYGAFKDAVKTSANYGLYIKDFANQYISTERLTRKQRSEYLREFQRYWIGKGVELTDPSLQGLDKNIEGRYKE
jgi:hypothetical protein